MECGKIVVKFENVYFINGTAYAGKSTMVKLLAEKYDGIACEENYQDRLLENLDTKEFPNLTYTRDLQDWGEFVRRTPDEYEAWVNGVTKECTVLEIEILKDLVSRTKKKIFVDTMRSGCMRSMVFKQASSQPFLGGSTTMTSGWSISSEDASVVAFS